MVTQLKLKIKNNIENKGEYMNKEILKEMQHVVEEFTVEFLKEVHEEFGYTNDDVANNVGGAYDALREGAELILTLVYGQETTERFNSITI